MDSLSQRIEIKSKLVDSLNFLKEQKTAALAKLSRLQAAKAEKRDNLAAIKAEILELKLNAESSKDQASGQQDLLTDYALKVDKFQQVLANDIGLADYAEDINRITSCIEQQIELYRDENLNMELKKKKNETKDLRIAYHELDQQYNELREEARKKDAAKSKPVEVPVQVVHTKPQAAPVEKRTYIPTQDFSLSQMLKF